MSRPAPVFLVAYDGHTVGVYTQAFRALACIRHLMMAHYERFCDKSKFAVVRVGLVPGSELALTKRDVTSSLLKFV